MRLWLEVVMSKDRRLVVAIAIALTVGLTGTGGAAPSGPPVRIGGTLALTGPLAATELLHKIAGEIYIDEMNRGNGLLGRPVEWVLLDDQSKAEVTRSLYKRLITVDRVDLLMGTPSRLITWAETTGPATAEFVAALLASKPHPEQGYRACLGVIRLSKTYGAARVDAACARALHDVAAGTCASRGRSVCTVRDSEPGGHAATCGSSARRDEQACEVRISHDALDKSADRYVEKVLEDIRIAQKLMGIAGRPSGDSFLKEQRTLLIVQPDDAADVSLNGPARLD